MSNYGFAGILAGVILLGLYVAPGFIASARRHHNAPAIWALNILLGWSALGWIAALVWALTQPNRAARP